MIHKETLKNNNENLNGHLDMVNEIIWKQIEDEIDSEVANDLIRNIRTHANLLLTNIILEGTSGKVLDAVPKKINKGKIIAV